MNGKTNDFKDMKKITLFAVFFGLMLINKGIAQDISFGVKAGLNVSSLGGAALGGSKPGFHAGMAAEIGLSDAFIVQPEALVSLQGRGDGFTGLSNNINLFYLTIPVALKYNIWDELYIEAGPQLSALLGDNLEDFGVESNSIDFGLFIGAGYRLTDNFYFQLRYSAGAINAIEDVTSKNRVLQASAVYFF